MSNTEVMSPDGQDGRTDRQTDEHIIFEAHYTMGPSGNKFAKSHSPLVGTNRVILICDIHGVLP